MATAIKAIPTLYGKEARRFHDMADEAERRIESIQDGVMKWKALRQREDGSTYTATFQMTKVEKE